MYACNPSAQAEVGSSQVQDQPELHSKPLSQKQTKQNKTKQKVQLISRSLRGCFLGKRFKND